ncbi:glycerol-3-phosphate acyltransferase [Sporosarcina highlanderae]|uniref:Glycerol-3-phosphate acyltransferase n=1 Tax=Sporosarcina highlanderae TaxID=3035916 RepID=A0ABT8JPX3_9BACL|nr:glycerol-3-phosphate acyltransferase [Sporosarcina highlanderae]MDN4606239.1 glycerol-3-phosphate acyltransferase [Sporosarcina highlanderae]
MTLWIVSIIVFGYIVGCLHGSTIARWISGVNLKETGVKNAGASNAMIVLGKKYGALVALIDIGKGIIAVFVVRWLVDHYQLPAEHATFLLFAVGAAVVFGHNFPFHMKFNGGKGTATVIGVLFAIDWRFGLAGFALFVLVALVTDLMVFGVLMLYITLILMAFWLDGTWTIFVAALLFLMAIWKHIENLKRIREGTEPRIRAAFKKKRQ